MKTQFNVDKIMEEINIGQRIKYMIYEEEA